MTRKPIRHYEQLWEDLMEYTSFTSTKEIETKEDLTRFFKELKQDAEQRGANKPNQLKFFKSRFVGRMVEAIRSMHGSGIAREKRKAQDVRPTRSLKQAKARGESTRYALQVQGRKIWKSVITFKGKQREVWRNEKGQFVKTPT